MYHSFRQFCERLLRIPRDPEPPPGDEARTRLFRAAPQYYKYLLVLWALKTLFAAMIGVWIAVAPIVGAVALVKEGHKSGLLLLLIPGVIVIAFIVLGFSRSRWSASTSTSAGIWSQTAACACAKAC